MVRKQLLAAPPGVVDALRAIRRFFSDPDFRAIRSFGQNGEDLVLARMLEKPDAGFYVDVGAHHPARFSNTHFFYRRGWRGINIDAQPGSMQLFRKHRPRDINIECGVAGKRGTLSYFRFDEPALNTFDESEAKLKDAAPYRLVDRVEVDVRPLGDILAEFLPAGQAIDFMTVDVEGLELDVLGSNDWNRFRPRIILTESLRTEILDIASSPVVRLLDTVGYKPVAKIYDSFFFERTGS
jgi:FkbM family methyltransferase